MNIISKVKKLDKKTKIITSIALALILISIIAVVAVVQLTKTKEVAETENIIEEIKIEDVTSDNLEVEYNTEPTTESLAVNIKNYDNNYNLYYYIQEIGQALTDEGTDKNVAEANQEENANSKQVASPEEVQNNEGEVAQEEKEIADSDYTLYQEEAPITIESNSIISFKYEHDGKFSPNAYKLEITNIIDEGEITEGATEEELKEEKVDPKDKANNTASYYIKINYTANVVTIYKKDANGDYTVPVKAMVCSTGKATPKSGVYKTTNKYVWKLLNGGVYGQYATRIVGSILFHSVPYSSPNHNALKYVAYDKLGTKASAGCIRLTVADAKWIYDNCGKGTMVEFYSSSNPGPLGKPTARKIASVVECRNYDPTDPVAGNPWATYKGASSETQQPATPPTADKPSEDAGANTPSGNPDLANKKVYELDTKTRDKVIDILKNAIKEDEELTALGASVSNGTKEGAKVAGVSYIEYSESAIKAKLGTNTKYYVYVENEYTYNETGTEKTKTKTCVYIYSE